MFLWQIGVHELGLRQSIRKHVQEFKLKELSDEKVDHIEVSYFSLGDETIFLMMWKWGCNVFSSLRKMQQILYYLIMVLCYWEYWILGWM